MPLWLTVFFLFLGLNLPVFAGAEVKQTAAQKPKELSVGDVSAKVEAAQAGAQDSQMDIVMEMKDSLSGAVQQVKGVLKTKTPDKVFVHYTKPSEQFLYVGGNLMRMYQPDQKTIYVQSGSSSSSAPVYLGVGRELKKYIQISRVSIIKNSDSEVGLLFLPLKDDAGFDRMKVFIHKKDWWPYQMEVETPSTIIKAHFSNFSFNQGLKDSLFDFTPPKDVQTVEGAIF
ncbi:MAG TPA: outer-membrane lipoprotein carrier protein LolA [bacterium]